MKKLILLLAIAAFCLNVSAQQDSVKTKQEKDTIRIGGMIIIKEGKENKDREVSVNIGGDDVKKKRSNVTTNWWILDLGFANYNDKTNYANAGSYLVNRPGYPALDKNDFKVKAGKSINVNIWVFMQRVNLIKHYVNLKYGLGVELNNYRYKSAVSYKENGTIPYSGGLQTSNAFVFRDSIGFSKNKLAADYLTVPFMINFNTNPYSSNKGLNISVGVSGGYLYSQRNKQESNERGKEKNKGEYDLEKFKFSYVAELGLGPVRLYGSYSPKSIYENSLDMRPYTVGFRFSNW